jgi:hypothetical protein
MGVFLTGRQDSIGSVLAKMRLQAGHDVTGLDSVFSSGILLSANSLTFLPPERPAGCGVERC